jgi:hypothetical protein
MGKIGEKICFEAAFRTFLCRSGGKEKSWPWKIFSFFMKIFSGI